MSVSSTVIISKFVQFLNAELPIFPILFVKYTFWISYDKNNDAQLSAPIFEGYKVIGYYYKNVKIADGDGFLFDQFQYFYDIEVTAKYEKE